MHPPKKHSALLAATMRRAAEVEIKNITTTITLQREHLVVITTLKNQGTKTKASIQEVDMRQKLEMLPNQEETTGEIEVMKSISQAHRVPLLTRGEKMTNTKGRTRIITTSVSVSVKSGMKGKDLNGITVVVVAAVTREAIDQNEVAIIQTQRRMTALNKEIDIGI